MTKQKNTKSRLEKIMEDLKKDIETPSRMCKFIGGPWDGKEYLISDKHEDLKIPVKEGCCKYKSAIYLRLTTNRFIYGRTE